ncbi:protein spinster-like [Artemia franciscana]|uniref:protein spinster-like n=1 Tax=Artemia franciscana TaxID=6661 RepID=UPI0032DBB858
MCLILLLIIMSITGDSDESPNVKTYGRMEYITVAILCAGNLINFMDRYTTAGTLADIQCHFGIGDAEGGLIQTLFITVYTVVAPLWGYLGDRYSRRYIMAIGIILWSAAGMASSFMGQNDFVWFVVLRCTLGIFEASFTTIAPTIISDLFVGSARSKMFAIYFFAIPVGSGLGYIVGALPLQLGAAWEWGLRITPFLGWIEAALFAFVILDPPRGVAEGSRLKTTSYKEDLKYLSKNITYILVTLAAAGIAFFAGAVAWWGPKFVALGEVVQTGNLDTSVGKFSLLFGIISMVCGLIGVPTGAYLGRVLKPRFIASESLITGAGLLLAAPFFFAVIYLARYDTTAVWIMLIIAQLFVNLNWALTVEIQMSVVIPTRRATSQAFNIFVSHALGDCISPYLIGLVSDSLKPIVTKDVVFEPLNESDECGTSSLDPNDFTSLQYALYITVVVTVIAGALALYSALFFEKDKLKAERALAEAAIDAEKKTGDAVYENKIVES